MSLSAKALLERFQLKTPLILDGGLATELQRRGQDVDDPLWSARVLRDNPDAVRQLHFDYLDAGAECLITASYQATFAGLQDAGIAHQAAANLMRSAINLAVEAKQQWQHAQSGHMVRAEPLIAASIGPYGAYRHDGSEYTGDYGLSRKQLADFHRERMQILADSDADLLACETIPSLLEAEALLEVLHEIPEAAAWFSFSCRDSEHTCHGEPISSCAKRLDSVPQVVAIGVNCTSPQYLNPLIWALRSETSKPIVVYPNSGESWDAQARCWKGTGNPEDFAQLAGEWQAAGANLIGGCCRTGPEHIRDLRAALKK